MNVVNNVLEIPDAREFIIKDCHRLPASKGRRPLIFKLNSMLDKQKIWDHIAKLKSYNQHRDENTAIFIEMNHLPRKLHKDKQSLLNNCSRKRY